ncbi:hypothetical protein [Streptomyces sp. NBC_00306]|uniref:hypothetical protein n=1 Tax=Streptomyces sp. NBC_00306 TaxID=2975708 RepID=UPI002E28AEC6|nr:hypothetical protein [Streptomyces sp. NBC_00306]
MNGTARELNSLAETICAAQARNRTPMGLALAVTAAGWISPDAAAELRARVADLESAAGDSAIPFSLTPEALHASSGAVVETREDVSLQVQTLRQLLALPEVQP